MEDETAAVQEMVNRETEAWNHKDADALVALFHPDMVWPWPPSPDDHDPITWVMPMGRFDADRWRASWQALFDTHDLVRNHRITRRIEVTPEGDGGFAVVDIDTVWRRRSDGADEHWTGRVCKVYTRCTDGWKLIMHTGVLDYPALAASGS
jgi:ketosteroid isomerase-like protein